MLPGSDILILVDEQEDHGGPATATTPAGGDERHELPPGFCFYPSDNEIVSHYLTNKVHNTDFTCTAVGEVDLNKIEPWDLPSM
jgi:hypothetical protein